QGLLDDLLGITSLNPAVHKDLSVSANKSDAYLSAGLGLRVAAVDDDNAVLINVLESPFCLRIIRRNDFDRAGLVHTQAPLGDIEMMGTPVRHHAARVFPVVAPVWEALMNASRAKDRVVWPLGGRTEPAI